MHMASAFNAARPRTVSAEAQPGGAHARPRTVSVEAQPGGAPARPRTVSVEAQPGGAHPRASHLRGGWLEHRHLPSAGIPYFSPPRRLHEQSPKLQSRLRSQHSLGNDYHLTGNATVIFCTISLPRSYAHPARHLPGAQSPREPPAR